MDDKQWKARRAKIVSDLREETRKAHTPEGRAAAAKLLSELPVIDNQRTTAHIVPNVKAHPSPEKDGEG